MGGRLLFHTPPAQPTLRLTDGQRWSFGTESSTLWKLLSKSKVRQLLQFARSQMDGEQSDICDSGCCASCWESTPHSMSPLWLLTQQALVMIA